MTDELVTAASPYGADNLDIRAVNPTGTNWIYDLSYFISNGDIPSDIAEKWEDWQHEFLSKQAYYRGLVSLETSVVAKVTAMEAQLKDRNGELEDLTNQQSVTIQALAEEITETGKQEQQELLDQINANIAAKKQEISDLEADIADEKLWLDPEKEGSYTALIQGVNKELDLQTYFTEEEYDIISQYFIE